MNKMLILLIILNIINLMISPLSECLKMNNNTEIFLTTCLNNNDNGTRSDGKLNKSETYCCLLTLTYNNESEKRACITTKGDMDIIEERIDMFEMQINVDKASIDCLSCYLYINILFIFLILFVI